MRGLGFRPWRQVVLWGLLLPLWLWALPALAQAASGGEAPPPAGFSERSNLLGDLGGLRPALKAIGITFALQEESEVFGNVAGGLHTGGDYAGLTTASVTLDTGQAFGWTGGTAFASALQIHGRNFGNYHLDIIGPTCCNRLT